MGIFNKILNNSNNGYIINGLTLRNKNFRLN